MTVSNTGNEYALGKAGPSVYIIGHKYYSSKIWWYIERTVTISHIEAAIWVVFAVTLLGKTFCRGERERTRVK